MAVCTAVSLCVAVPLGIVQAAEAQQPGTPAPDFALRSINGENLRLSEYQGSVVLLGFWARWCGDCRQAMQALNEIHAKYQKAGLVTLGIDVDDSEEQAATMVRSLGISFPVLLDAARTASSQFNLRSMPLLVLIDREGKIRFTHTGYERGHELLVTDKLRQLLNE